MFVTGPHMGLATQHGLPHVTRAGRRCFTGPADFLQDAAHRADIGMYLSDMIRPYGLTVPEGLFGPELSGDLGHSYGEMAEALIGAVVPADEPVDLLILAFAIHDVRPGRATAPYLSYVCPGNPFAFAICDQGSAAAFTGLRLAREYFASAACRRALLLVVEQAVLPYDASPNGSAPHAPIPSRHSGVALLLGDSSGTAATLPAPAEAAGSVRLPGSTRLSAVRQHTDIGPERVDDLFSTEVADLSAGYADMIVVLGSALATAWSGRDRDNVRVGPAGQPYTGVWWELVGALSERGEDRRVLLADYDPALRYLCVSAIDHG